MAGVDRLMMINKVSIIQPLPISYRDQILRIPGVKRVTFDVWFGGIYQDPKNFFPSFAIDTENQREVYPELQVADDQWKAFLDDREGAIAGPNTAKRFGWKIGDRIPLQAPIYGGTLGIQPPRYLPRLARRRQFTSILDSVQVSRRASPGYAQRPDRLVYGEARLAG